MKIFVKAKTGSKKEEVLPPEEKLFKEEERSYYTVSTKERPVDGKANYAITRLLAKHFGISVSEVDLVSGHSSKIKVFEIAKN